jgi:hypothetical protein
MRLVLYEHPSIARTIHVSMPEGVSLAVLIDNMIDWARRRLSKDEWDSLDKRTRDAVRASFQRRTGGIHGYAAMAETPYLIVDVLGESTWFLGLERGKLSRSNHIQTYVLHTTHASRCHVWRSTTPRVQVI